MADPGSIGLANPDIGSRRSPSRSTFPRPGKSSAPSGAGGQRDMIDPTPLPQAPIEPAQPGKLAQDIETIADNVAEATQIVAKANWWTALVGICTALPGMVRLAERFWDWANKVSGGSP